MVGDRSDSVQLAIVGAGSLGQAFGALLAAAGQSVVLVARASSAERLLAQGSVRLAGAVQLEVPVSGVPAAPGYLGVSSDAAAIPPSAGLVFTTKGHQLAAAAREVQAAWPASRAGWVCGVQNGLQKDDVLAEAFGHERVVGAVTIFGAQREPSGHVQVGGLGATYLGEFGGQSSQRVTDAVGAFGQAGIPTSASSAIEQVLWSKACNAAGVFGVSVLTRLSAAQMNGDPHLVRAYMALVRETAAIAAYSGVELGDYPGFPIRTYVDRPDEHTVESLTTWVREHPSPPGQPPTYPSMTQDVLAGRELEVEGVFGDLVRRGERAGVPVPRLTLVRDLIAGLDARARASSSTFS